jgi:predicted DNA binding CopG/RHH family protein
MGKGEKTTAENLEARFEAGQDVLDYFDVKNATRPGWEKQRINLDIPQGMLADLDRHAGRRGVPRQALIKLWLADRLKAEAPVRD